MAELQSSSGAGGMVGTRNGPADPMQQGGQKTAEDEQKHRY